MADKQCILCGKPAKKNYCDDHLKLMRNGSRFYNKKGVRNNEYAKINTSSKQ